MQLVHNGAADAHDNIMGVEIVLLRSMTQLSSTAGMFPRFLSSKVPGSPARLNGYANMHRFDMIQVPSNSCDFTELCCVFISSIHPCFGVLPASTGFGTYAEKLRRYKGSMHSQLFMDTLS